MAEHAAPLTSDNVGWKLLKKAGWTEGHGIGAQEQGPKEPIQPSVVSKGQAGLGFRVKSKVQSKKRQYSSDNQKLGKLKKKQSNDDGQQPTTDQKEQRNDAEEERKAIARFVYSSFKEESEALENSHTTTNPLLRGKKSRISATNPLL